MKEIGGYLEFEEFSGQEYYPDLYKLNLGRTAILYLLEGLHCKKLLMPYFLCDSVTDICTAYHYPMDYYFVDQNLTPLLDEALLPEGTYLYLVNYYGQLSDEKILHYKQVYGNIIVDHTHSFFQRPVLGVPTMYSCRKFFGLSDGAYLYSDIPLTPLNIEDESRNRFGHILGRYEEDAAAYYTAMCENAATYHSEVPKKMSRLTQNLLRALDYDKIKKKRNENYASLDKRLGKINCLPFFAPDGPLAYPFYAKDGISLRKKLAEKKIFVPTYWSNVISSMPKSSQEYDYAANILALPCDQRYGSEEMEIVADAILENICEGRTL